MQRYNDFRDYVNSTFGVAPQLRREIIKMIMTNPRIDNKKLSKNDVLQEIESLKQSYINCFERIYKEIDENYKIYEGKYLAKVNYGYNGIVTGKIYFVNIHGNKVEFYADEAYQYHIPQSLPFDDINVIEEPTQKDIDKAKENGRNSYHGYFHHFPEQEDVR